VLGTTRGKKLGKNVSSLLWSGCTGSEGGVRETVLQTKDMGHGSSQVLVEMKYQEKKILAIGLLRVGFEPTQTCA
jgi:hypothetical protein